MNRLPAETVAEIISQLQTLLAKDIRSCQTPRLAPYSTINRTWQEAIERETFRSIYITTDTLPKLVALLNSTTGNRRLRCIRDVRFRFIPTRPSKPSERRRVLNEYFSKSMAMLFGLIKGWEERLGVDVGDQYQLCLQLEMEYRGSAPDPRLLPRRSVRDDLVVPSMGDAPPDEPVEDPVARANQQYISDEKLPELCMVSSMMIIGHHLIPPERIMRIISRMTCLVQFEGFVFDSTTSLDLALEYRQVLAQNLHLLPRSLRLFRPGFPEYQILGTSCSELVDPQCDHLCLGLRALSGRLRNLYTNGLRISLAIFAGDGSGTYPDWSSLEEVDITYPVISSTGQWFATADPTQTRIYYPNEDDIIYSIPNPTLLNELYAAAGKARQHMPSLKCMKLSLSANDGNHEFLYGFDRDRNRGTIRLESSVAFDFGNEVAEAWGFGLDDVNTFADTLEYGDTTFCYRVVVP